MRARSVFPIALFAAIVSTGLLVGCGPEEAADIPVAQPETAVRVVSLEPQSFSTYLEVTGTLRARSHIDVIVEEAGTVREILVKKGDFAKAGSTLAVLENRVAQATFGQTRAALRQAQLDHNSKKVLFEKKAISENEYLRSLYSLEAAQAAHELTGARTDKLRLLAPVDGFVNERHYDLGAYASPITPFFELIDSDVLRVRFGVAERFLADIETGTPVEISFDAYPDLKVDAEVDFVSRSVDPQSRTFQVEVEIRNPGGMLAPHMIANVKVLRRTYTDAIVVPLDALVETEDGWYVFVETEGRARSVAVRQVAIYEDHVLVEGLMVRQNLVVAGQHGLSDGDQLRTSGT